MASVYQALRRAVTERRRLLADGLREDGPVAADQPTNLAKVLRPRQRVAAAPDAAGKVSPPAFDFAQQLDHLGGRLSRDIRHVEHRMTTQLEAEIRSLHSHYSVRIAELERRTAIPVVSLVAPTLVMILALLGVIAYRV